MTVKYLQNHQLNLQRQQAAISQATDATIATKFKAGFTECANEVGRFPGMEPQVKRRLLQHLSNCLSNERQEQQKHNMNLHILPSPPSSPEQDSMSHITSTTNGYYLTNGTGSGVQLIPTKLPNGNIAFVLPQSTAATQLPMLVPIPSRTASTSSATSSNYDRLREHSTSPYNAPPSPVRSDSSYEAMDTSTSSIHHHHRHHQQQLNLLQQQQLMQQRSYEAPISLVMRKTNFDDQQMKDGEEKPWRPW
jgi:hairy and enhancer of split, invertebrate